MMKRLLLIALIFTLSSSAVAQKGFLRGKVLDGSNGEGMFGTNVVVKGTTTGVTTDFEGNYSLPLEAGTYTVVFSFISYNTQEITDIVIKAGEVTTLADIIMKEDSQVLDAVVVTAERLKDNETAMLSLKKKSINTVDGISAQSFKKIGDSNLSNAMKRVTGVSVQGGKYVYVRGLGDRYTKTTLNGMTIPGIDPDRNDVQIDLFPTSILENVVVYKTFSPQLSADFTGGNVDIETKAFPDEKYTALSFGLGFNPDMNLNSNFRKQTNGGGDFLGFGKGDRSLPFDGNTTAIPDPSTNDAALTDLTQSMNKDLAVANGTSFLNTSFSLAHGNQINKEKVTFGYNAVLNYKRNFTHYEDAVYARYELDNDKREYELLRDITRRGARSQDDVLWSALVAGSAKTDNSSHTVSLLRIQNGTETNLERDVNSSSLNNPGTFANHVLRYTQRSITNGMYVGKFNTNNIQHEGKLAYSISKVDDPDFRNTLVDLTEGDDDANIDRSGAGVNRYFRTLDEQTLEGRYAIMVPLGERNKVRGGVALTRKSRDFNLLTYDIDYLGASPGQTDPNWYLQDGNIWTPATGVGSHLTSNVNPNNNYESSLTVLAAFAMTELSLTSKLKTIFGARIEKADMLYTGSTNSRGFLDKEKTLDDLDILPSVNFIYSATDKMNLRLSANRTLARPSFKEKSEAFIPDPITGLSFNGNINLEAAKIWNFDFRWEYFMAAEEMVSVSFFYKDFTDHIIIGAYDVAPRQVRPRNIDNSKVFGVELEARKDLSFIHDRFKNFSLGSNISLVKSEVDRSTTPVNDQGTTELENRLNVAREGQEVSVTRDMAGQAPYLINGFLSYNNNNLGLNATMAYNVQGETLTLVGVNLIPDIYTKQFHSLNLNVSKTLGKDDNSSISLSVKNILNDDRELVYKNDGSEERIFSLLSPGRTFNVKYSVRF